MAPVVFGLDLGQMSWGAFSSKNMFGNRDWHLRRSKLAVYQCALIFCVVSESLGTDVLSDYIDQQRYLKSVSGGRAYEYNNDYVGVASYNIFAGVYVAFIFGAAFFFDLFFPGRHEAKSIRLAWKICGCLAVIFHLADALALTIITATRSAYVTGQPQYVTQQNLADFHKDGGVPLTYRKDGRAVAAVVFVWLGWVSVFASNMLLFFSIHNTEYGKGPKTAHAEGREAAHLYANTPVAERHRLQDPEAQFMANNEKPEINGAVPGNVDGTAGTNATSNTGTAAEIPTQQANNAHTKYHISNPDEERANGKHRLATTIEARTPPAERSNDDAEGVSRIDWASQALDDSGVTEDSNFTVLATKRVREQYEVEPVSPTGCKRKMKVSSWASLTSGMA